MKNLNKNLLILIVGLLFLPFTTFSQPPGSGWNVVYADEFDGNNINENRWFVRTNGVFTRDQVVVNNGTLKLNNTYTNNGVIKGGWITSKQKFGGGSGNIKYGFYEARVRIQWNPNGSIWPTWWIWGNRVNGVTTTEIDIMEYSGFSKLYFNNRATSSHHYRGKVNIGGSNQTTTSAQSVLNRNPFEWHRWGILWTPNELSFYYDGVKYMSSSQPGDARNSNDPLGLIFSTSPHTINADPEQPDNPRSENAARPGQNFPALEVDWVRVWTGGNTGGGNGGGNNPVVAIKKGNATNFGIDGNNGGGDGQNVYLWSASNGNINQQWVEINRGNGYYSYQKRNTNFCLDGGNGGANGQNVYLWTCNNNQNQHWRKVNLGNGKYRLEKRNAPGFSIDGGNGGSNGQNLYLWSSSNGNQNQHWQFTTIQSGRSAFIGPLKEPTVNQIEIYPNPSNGNFNINFNQKVNQVNVILTDISGRIVYKEVIENTTSKSVNTQGLPSGIYILNLQGKDINLQDKLVIE
ncbi:RICIN domain-containing protein [uncultured Aquimarina sp.]|uniref:RICIN domain-containing protein n=1 Tax=uncultured Aquimarina sp. TaxID=575652 RepID=UPI002603EDE4|nr:RICIN domain-containing protein [uncultured Aquimarina sp.]